LLKNAAHMLKWRGVMRYLASGSRRRSYATE